MIQTLINRPYVFAFLIAFLVLGRIYWGWRKTFLWLVIGYVIAWASEFSSIHNGFPYGLYYYRYENMVGELMVFGVPFWDSLSYPFMIFAGYTTARFILGLSSPRRRGSPASNCISEIPANNRGDDLRTALFGALLTMLLDVIIDPLTVLGDRWFLGNIYYYPNGGEYFGVPLTNFAGWFVVPLAVILIFQYMTSSPRCPCHPRESGDPVNTRDSRVRGNDNPLTHLSTHALKHFLNPLFYLSIALFNIAITMWIGETLLASIDCMLLIPVVGLLMWRIKRQMNT